MKKLVALLMILMYGLSSSGATVQLHYCCGKVKSISLGAAAIKDCGMMKTKMGSKPCCETKSVSAREQHQHHEVYSIITGFTAPAEPAVLFNSIQLPVLETTVVKPRLVNTSPPLYSSLLSFICSFRI